MAATALAAADRLDQSRSGGERDDDLSAQLVRLEAQCALTRRLSRILRAPQAAQHIAALAAADQPSVEAWHASPLGHAALESLWREVFESTNALVRIDPVAVRALCAQHVAAGRKAEYIADLLVGPEGVWTRATRAAAFLTERAVCVRDPLPARIRTLARAAPAFAADLQAQTRRFRRAMHELRALARAPLKLHVFGFGEISRPVGLVRRASPLAAALPLAPLVYKPLAPFPDIDLVTQYVRVYEEYHRRLRDEAGIAVPEFGYRRVRAQRGRIVIFTTQAALPAGSIAKTILLQRDAEQCLVLCRMVLDEYRKLARYNNAQQRAEFTIGIDGQITNWAVRRYAGDAVPLRGDEGLFYIDTNTPMMRRHGVDCLPLSFYLQGVPRMMRLMARPMAKKVLDRYFNPRTILLDFLANTSIHGRADLVDVFLHEGNAFLREGLLAPTPRPISKEEVERYIAKDISTWRLSRSMRAVEEMVQGRHGPLATCRRIYQIYTTPIF